MRGTVAKRLRKETDDLEVRGTKEWRQKYQQLKRIHTTKERHGDDAYAGWGAKHTPNLEASSRGGKASPTNFKNNPELARKAGRSRRK